MSSFPQRLTKFTDRIPGHIYLWLAIPIFGSSSAVTRKITEIGAQHLVGCVGFHSSTQPTDPCTELISATAICDQTRHKYSKIKDNKLKNIERWQHIQLTCEKRYLVLGKIKKVHSES
jgi:hypothetical protein